MLISKRINSAYYLYDSDNSQIYKGNRSALQHIVKTSESKNKKLNVRKVVKKNKKLRIGIFFDGLQIPPCAGIPYRFYYLSHEIQKNNVEIVVFLCDRFSIDPEILRNEPFEFHLFSPDATYNNLNLVQSVVEKARVDILQVDHSQTALWYGIQISQNLQIPLVTEMHDVDSKLRKSMGAEKNEIEKQEFIQFAAGIASDHVICVAQSDYSSLIELGIPAKKISVIENGIDIEKMAYKTPNINSDYIIFLGNMFYPPNKDAVERLITQVIPHVPKKLICVGMVDSKFQAVYESEKVHFTGMIDDISEYIYGACLAVAPIYQGSGMKVKMLNFAALGVPILTTKEGVAGYPRQIAYVENSIDKYPQAINKILSEENSYYKKSLLARDIIENNFFWKSKVPQIISLYKKCAYEPKINFGTEIINECIRMESPLLEYQEHVPLPIWLEDEKRAAIQNNNQKEYYFIEK